MKAFASVLLAAALLFPLVLFISATANAGSESGEMLAQARAAEANYYEGEGVLNAAFAAMIEAASEKAPGDAKGVREAEEEIGEQLAKLGAFAEEQGKKEGVQVRMWCGSFSGYEREMLVQRMAEKREALACDACLDATAVVLMLGVSVEGKPKAKNVPACAFFTSVVPAIGGSGKVGAGNSLLVHSFDEEGTKFEAPELRLRGISEISPAAIGVSIYDSRTGAASVAYIPGGKMRDYG